MQCVKRITEMRMETLSPPRMTRRSIRLALTLVMMAFLGVMAPLGVVQDLQHQVASAGPDSQQHSDSDFCQWVQHHTAGSLDNGAPFFTAQELVALLEFPANSVLLSTELSTPGPSRAPPRS